MPGKAVRRKKTKATESRIPAAPAESRIPEPPAEGEFIALPQVAKVREIVKAAQAREAQRQANQGQAHPAAKRTKPNKENMAPIVQAFRRWRTDNAVSVRVASEVMAARGYDFPAPTLRNYEAGARTPGRYTERLLKDFLAQFPRIDDAPFYPPGPKPSR